MRELPPNFPPMDLKQTTAKAIQRGPLAVVGFIVKCFSKSNLRRDPPMPGKTIHLRLITIVASHFCEKVRWGLDLLEQDPKSPYYYTEDGHTPPFLSFETVPASGNKFSASPMIVYPDGTYLAKSDAILRKHCQFLYPQEIAGRVKELEDDLGFRVGTSLRCVVYHQTLRKPYFETISDVLSKNTSRVEGVLLHAMMEKGVAHVMKKLIRVNQETYDASLPVLREVFSELSEVLSDGREFLCDNTSKSYGFTAADLTLAALAAPLLQPESYFATFGVAPELLPPELKELQTELRATLAGQHVMKMYKNHRPVMNGTVVVKSSPGRDQLDWSRLLPVTALLGATVVAAGSAVVSILQRG